MTKLQTLVELYYRDGRTETVPFVNRVLAEAWQALIPLKQVDAEQHGYDGEDINWLEIVGSKIVPTNLSAN